MLATGVEYCKILSRVVVRAGCTRATASNEGKMAEDETSKTLQVGTLVYQLWCRGAEKEDIGPLVMTLNVTRGVTRTTCQVVDDGTYVAVIINTEFDIQGVIGRINGVAIGWAKRHGVIIIDASGQPVYQ